MVVAFWILVGFAILFIIAMSIAFRIAPMDPYEKMEEERFLKNNSADERRDDENEEDQP